MSNKKQGFTHDNVDNVSVDWYTPSWIFNDLGIVFDLDPAAPSERVISLKLEEIKKLEAHTQDPKDQRKLELAKNACEQLLKHPLFDKGVPWIPVRNVFDEVDDGLRQEWFGNVWLNPPYGKHTAKWLEKMHEHRNGIALVFARTDNNWFHDYVVKADAILFIKQRVKFVDGLGLTSGNGAGSGSMLIAWGSNNVIALEKMRNKGALWNLN